MSPRFLKLHYPWYWHYDVLGGLVAMAGGGISAGPNLRVFPDASRAGTA